MPVDRAASSLRRPLRMPTYCNLLIADYGSTVHERNEAVPMWRLRNLVRSKEFALPLTPRFASDDMLGLKQAAIEDLGIVALPCYVCREEVQSGTLQRVLPEWLAAESTLTALMPNRQGLLPSVRAFIKHLSAELPKVVVF